MFLSLLQFFATKFLVLALHLESGSFPRPLSAQEEAEVFAALRAGDPAAREKLIRHNLRLVAHIVKKYYALPGDQDDLISIGTIGLMKAVDTFDSARRARFSTYASRCIENEIRMQFRRNRKTGGTVSLQEALESDGDSALTLADVLQDSFCMEEQDVGCFHRAQQRGGEHGIHLRILEPLFQLIELRAALVAQRDVGAAADVQALQVACSHAVADEMKLERFHG